MARRWQTTAQQRLDERREVIRSLKEGEERASQQRMAALLEAEQLRQESLAVARAAQRERDRRMYLWAVVTVLIFVCIVVMVMLLTGG
jgi:hypothetical protein